LTDVFALPPDFPPLPDPVPLKTIELGARPRISIGFPDLE
jgi:hypothetical protein